MSLQNHKLNNNNASENMSQTPSSNESNLLEKEINLNDFLDFLNLSCHVNDMISENSEFQQQQQTQAKNDASQLTKLSGRPSNKSLNIEKTLDFDKLKKNRLLNDLYGGQRNARTIADNYINGASTHGTCSNRACINSVATSSGTAGQNCNCSTKYSGQSRVCGRTVKSPTNVADGNLQSKLNDKLDTILNEGMLDSVLPFICPIPLPNNYTNRLKPKGKSDRDKSLLTSVTVLPGGSEGSTSELNLAIDSPKSRNAKRKTSASLSKPESPSKEAEVIIHVCDEVKNTSRDFACPQTLLISKMGYFANVTAGQNLDDIDISVHCDIQIFDWLMKWMKFSAEPLTSNSTSPNDNIRPFESQPQLSLANVVPILVSASFLQMEPLLLDCLSYCHANLDEVVKASHNLSCLNDTIVTRLAAMFTNVELEMVQDKKERLAPRLWIKLIQSLCESEPEALRGHHYTLAGLFRCTKCHKYLTNTMKSYVSCIPSNVRLNRWGQVISHHTRDSSWDLSSYITQLFKEVKSWRLVYWKLWGHAHYLYCCLCETYFPVHQMCWCRYHPESPIFLGPIVEGRMSGPAGRYACCGQQVFRFETLITQNGCQFRDHSVLVETDRERSILAIYQLASENCALGDHPPWKLKEIAATGQCEPRWVGMSLLPQRRRQGLLPTLNPAGSNSHLFRRATASNFFFDSSTESESLDSNEQQQLKKKQTDQRSHLSSLSTISSTSSDGYESSDTSKGQKLGNFKSGKKNKSSELSGRQWSGELSARSNQDHQREYEEKVMKQLMDLVEKKTNTEAKQNYVVKPLGGTYIRLEQDWKDSVKQRMGALGVSASSVAFGICGSSSSSTSLALKPSRSKNSALSSASQASGITYYDRTNQQ
ncbi:uncharacterized protein KIAA1841 homolog [Glossina fuscipes]|uniref:Uncharacterized protein KIAA1841 homolog n=1 Tax=Glossina fuscipes TaxID=7396 RepID=A0A8U0W794_9MUSC|nr:uncharacterized protein KIAA1841 homolog [Glossina fuscipes]